MTYVSKKSSKYNDESSKIDNVSSDSDTDDTDEPSSDSDSDSNDEPSYESKSEMSTTLLPIGNKFVRQKFNGYVSVNDIKKVSGTKKSWCHFKENKSVKKFIKELMLTTNLSKDKLIIGTSHNRWIHPYLAIHFSQWISPIIAVEMSRFLYSFISGSFTPSEYTNYIQTMSENKSLLLFKSSFENENEKLKKELLDIKSNNSLFENETLKKELVDFKSSKKSLKSKNEKLKKELVELKSFESENETLKKKLSDFKLENETLKKELVDFKLSKKSLESKIEKLNKELVELKSFKNENKTLKKELSNFEHITINNKSIKIDNGKKYDLSIENDVLILTPKSK